MKKTNDIIDKLDQLIVQCSIDRATTTEDINDFTDLITDLGYDSISIITLIVRIEEEFQICFEDDLLSLDYIKNYKWLKEYLIGKAICDNEQTE